MRIFKRPIQELKKSNLFAGLLFCILSFVMVSKTYCQKLIVAKGKAQLRIEKNLTQEETESKTIALAKINAIESEFGTYVEQQSNIKIDNTTTEVSIIAGTKVKGDWVETVENPKFTYDTRKLKNGEPEVWITCEVKGKIREIKSVPSPLEAYTLLIPDISGKTTDFTQNNSFYLWLKTADVGYVTVYMLYNKEASRLLPYQNMGEKYLNAVPVEADKAYIFFSKEKSKLYFNDVAVNYVDEMKLVTDEVLEKDLIYVIYSPTPFKKPILEDNSNKSSPYTLPASLSETNFNQWLSDNMTYNPAFTYKVIPITIKGK